MIKDLWRGRKFFAAPYPIIGPQTTGLQKVVVDLLKSIQEDTIDTLSVRLTGNVIVGGGGASGTATGAPNPQGLFNLTTLQTAPQASGLIPINAVSARGAVVDYGFVTGAFPTLTAIPDTTGTHAVDAWLHWSFKRTLARKGIEFAHPLKKWKTDLLTVILGTRDQLFTGGTNTWDMSGVTVEFWADMDVDSDPDNIHATEIFEQDFNILANNSNFQINQLPQGCLYDNLYLIQEDAGALTDGIIQNIDIEGAGRFWLLQGDGNADFVRQRFTRPYLYDPNQTLTGLHLIPLRDGLWSRGLDAVSQPIVLKLAVTSLSATSLIRLVGRKLVPGGIKKTVVGPDGKKTVTGLPNA